MMFKKVDISDVRSSTISKVLDEFWDKEEEETNNEKSDMSSRFIYKVADLDKLYADKGLTASEVINILKESTENDYMPTSIGYEQSEFEILHNIVLDIENELMVLDSIFNKYIGEFIPKDLVFIKNYRYPLFSQSLISGNMEISKKPFHPFLCVEAVAELLSIVYIDNSGVKSDFNTNKLIPENNCFKFNKYLRSGIDLIEIIYKYIFFKVYETNPDTGACKKYVLDVIDPNDIKLINDVIENIVNKFLEAVKLYNQNAFSIDYSGRLFIINIGVNIQAFRYNEAIEYNEYNCISTDNKVKQFLNDYDNVAEN